MKNMNVISKKAIKSAINKTNNYSIKPMNNEQVQ